MSDASYAEIAQLLPEGPPLCLTTHESPDGDAIGLTARRGSGARVGGARRLALPRRVDADAPRVRVPAARRASTASLRPTSSSASCGRSTAAARAASAPTRACSSDRCASSTSITTTTTPASARSISSTREAACTAQIVERLLREAEIPITSQVAEALYVGLVTDTGRFQYSNTTPEAFRLAARLVDAGAQPARVFAAIWETVPFAKQRLLGIALEHARLEVSGKLLVTWLRRHYSRVATRISLSTSGVVDGTHEP